MWLAVMQRIQDRLIEAKVAPIVSLGAVNPVHASPDENGAVFIIRGEERRGENDLISELRVALYLEAWVRDDHPDMRYGYQRLSLLEERIEAVLSEIRSNVGALKETDAVLDNGVQLIDIAVEQKTGDLDSLRPQVGTQYTLEARLYLGEDKEGIW